MRSPGSKRCGRSPAVGAVVLLVDRRTDKVRAGMGATLGGGGTAATVDSAGAAAGTVPGAGVGTLGAVTRAGAGGGTSTVAAGASGAGGVGCGCTLMTGGAAGGVALPAEDPDSATDGLSAGVN